ncbi:FecR family protein [Mucilaginibacter celer]|nr:FecR domain-containing protein [Mucilaginibacter celer]
MESAKLNELIKKYMDGTATAAEQDELLQWYRRDEASEDLLSPYENVSKENEAKARLLNNLFPQLAGDARPVPRIGRNKPVWYSVAAAVLIMIGAAAFFISKNSGNNNADNLSYSVIKTARGEHKKLTLADGSVIWLGPEASVKYPVAFSGDTREIDFSGEAFFDIAKDKHHPFIVHTGNTSVKVLGTTFNINTYHNLTVSLLTGKVAFEAGAAKQQLTPGQRIVYTRETGAIKTENIPDAESIAARRDGYYEYKNIRVADVIEDVNRNFNTNIKVEGGVKDCLFYGRLKTGESVNQFVVKLGKIVNAQVINEPNIYMIKGGGCN